jgi:hypothetical protein
MNDLAAAGEYPENAGVTLRRKRRGIRPEEIEIRGFPLFSPRYKTPVPRFRSRAAFDSAIPCALLFIPYLLIPTP